MNAYWFDATGKIVSAAHNTRMVDVLASPLSGDYEWTLSDTRIEKLDDYYLEEGVFITKPPRPSRNHRWDAALKAWDDPRTIGELRDHQWTKVKKSRDAAEVAGFSWDGSAFDSDSRSQIRIQGAAQRASAALAAGQPFSIDWTLADNTVRTLSIAEMLAVNAALGDHLSAIQVTARNLRAAIAVANKATVRTLDWPGAST